MTRDDIQRLLDSTIKPPKKKKPPYKKPQSVKDLEIQEYNFRYKNSSMPEYARFKENYRDDTANGLTKCIIKWFKINGYFATRITSSGTYRPELKKFIPSMQRKGTPDLTAIVNGKAIWVEVKIGHDRMSEAQLDVKREMEQSGAIYIIAKNFDGFLSEILTIK